MNVRWSKTALAELDEIFRYISKRDRRAASSVVRRIEALTERLEQFPHSGRLTNETGARVVPVVRYPFVIFYAIGLPADDVVILHIRTRLKRRRSISFAAALRYSAALTGAATPAP